MSQSLFVIDSMLCSSSYISICYQDRLLKISEVLLDMNEEAGKLENFLPLKGSSENESQEKMSHRRRPRRSSIGAIDTTVVSTKDEEFFTPENENINETYNQFAEQRVSPIRRVPERRSSFTKFETEMMLHHSPVSYTHLTLPTILLV